MASPLAFVNDGGVLEDCKNQINQSLELWQGACDLIEEYSGISLHCPVANRIFGWLQEREQGAGKIRAGGGHWNCWPWIRAVVVVGSYQQTQVAQKSGKRLK